MLNFAGVGRDAAQPDEGDLGRAAAAGAVSSRMPAGLSHLAEIEAGLADADRGDFATEAEIEAVLRKYLLP